MRYRFLESLRGLAALVVVVHHHLLVFPLLFPYQSGKEGWPLWLTFSPLHLLWAGSEAVLFFFLLSGFVLSLPYWRGEALDMVRFVVRRWWRIWVPMMVAVTLAALCYWRLGHEMVLGTSWWFENIWKEAGLAAYAQHALMLGQMSEGLTQWAFIPVVWSLKWEMWLSLLLPLVLLLAGWRTWLALPLVPLLLALHHIIGGGDIASGLLRYLAMFVLGAWLARKREVVAAWVGRLPGAVKVLALLGALLIIPVQWYGWQSDAAWWRQTLNDLVSLLGSAALVALALGWSGWSTWLERPALSWLGRVSYSLYLYHALVLTLVVRLGAEKLPLPWLVLLSFCLTFPVAHLAYRFVELPALNQARRVKERAIHKTIPAASLEQS